MKPIPLARPDHPDDPAALLATLREIVLSGRWTEGEYAASFERRVAEVCGSIYAVATNSGTSALEAILASLGIGRDDEVILPSYTFIATINAVLSCGATPVFGDIDPHTYNLDIEDVKKQITAKTKALILVHQFGIPSDGDEFIELCKQRNLEFIEDAACGLGSKYKDKAIGTYGRCGLLSFHPRKVVSTGEGGMILTDDEPLAVRARAFGNHGRTDKGPASMVGHNHRMSEFQAAIGLWALDRSAEAISRRVFLAKRYEAAFHQHSNISLILEPGRAHWNRQSFPIRIQNGKRDFVKEALHKEEIETSIGPHPAHLHAYIEHTLRPRRLPKTEAAYTETLLLPIFAALTPKDQDRVIHTVLETL